MTTLAVYSNQGGVGKSVTAVNLAYLAAQDGYVTLLADLDPQGAATFCYRIKPKLKRQARGLVGDNASLALSIKETDYENLDMLPADFSHRNLDANFSRQKRPQKSLAIALKQFRRAYDLIILDCPPTTGILAENIFRAADCLLVPLIPATLSERSYERLLTFLANEGRLTQQLLAFFSMVDVRRAHQRQIIAAMRVQYSGILGTSIPNLSLVEQMFATRKPLPAFAPSSSAAGCYRALWTEVREEVLEGR